MTADTAPRWYVVIDPKGAANIVSDLAPGPDAVLPGLKPAGRAEPFGRRDYGHAEPGGWRDAGALPTARSWDRAVAAMNAHNGRVSPYSRFLSPDVPSAGTPPRTRPTADAATDVDARLEDAPGDDGAAAALATARDPESGMTTRQRNRVLAPTGERWCAGCDAAYPFSAFYRHRVHGFQAQCRACKCQAQRRDKASVSGSPDTRAQGAAEESKPTPVVAVRPAAAYRARVAPSLTGLTRGSAEELRATAASEKPKPLPAAAVDREPSAPTTSSSAPVTRRPPECSPSPALSPTMQTRLTCGCTVTYNCEVAETLRARCTLAQRTVRDERAAGGVSTAAQEASAAAIQAYHAHRGPFVPGGKA